MDIKCFSDRAYSMLNAMLDENPDELIPKYDCPKSWASEYLEDLEIGGKIVYPVFENVADIKLVCPSRDDSRTKKAKSDIDNCIAVYESLKGIMSPSYASSAKLWSYLCHETFYEYMYNRWNEDIKKRFFFEGGGARQLIRNGIARLWWIPHATYDEKRSDPYELTRVILRRQRDMEEMLGRDLTLNQKVLHCLLDVLSSKNEDEYSSNMLRAMMEDLNKIGGVSVLDALTKDMLTQLFERKFKEFAAKGI